MRPSSERQFASPRRLKLSRLCAVPSSSVVHPASSPVVAQPKAASSTATAVYRRFIMASSPGGGAIMRLIGYVICILGFGFAFAQGYPSKPVRLIVPFPPGGSSDLVARSIMPTLGEFLGQQIIIEYKGGAGGSIGTAEAARAAPDGYTLLIVWDTHAV